MTVTTFKVSPAIPVRQVVSASGQKSSREYLAELRQIVQKRAVLFDYSPSALAATARTRGTRNGLLR